MSSGSLSGPVPPPLAKVTEHGIPNPDVSLNSDNQTT